jgi:hypothetical protein
MAQEIKTRKKLIVANAINYIVEINSIIVENMRKGKPAELQFPRTFDRAFIIHHEAGVIPVIDLLED